MMLKKDPKKARKRAVNRNSWQCNVRKLKRNKGVEYFTKKGHKISAKTFNPCADHHCKKTAECQSVTLEDRKELFTRFWNLGDYNLQQAYICGSVSQTPATTHTVVRRQNEHSTDTTVNTGSGTVAESVSLKPGRRKKIHYKNFTRSFSFNTSKGVQVVCKELFLKTLQVSKGRVERALLAQRVNGGVAQVDRRGKHVKKAVDEDSRKFVIEHISSFPKYVSHYTRSHQEHRNYLAPHLSLRIMYKLYRESCLNSNKQPVKESYYRHIFVTKFNLHFHQPLKDTCQKCDRFDIILKSDPNDVSTLQQQELHLSKADGVRQKLNNSKNVASKEHLIITFDLQKTLICPVITCGVAYYKRQLSVYNLGVHNLEDNSASIFMWDESKAGRGASEIGSCLLQYVKSQMIHGLKSVTAFSDSCGGQNRNFKIATLMSFLVQDCCLQSVTLHFMQSGHSFLPNDADFGVIERAKKGAVEVYLPQHWQKVVANARKRHPFAVIDMQSEDFIDLTAMSLKLVNRKTADDGSKVSWLNIQSIQFTDDRPQVMKFKYVCDAEAPWFAVDLARHTRYSAASSQILLVKSTSEPRKLNKHKVNDLLSLKPFIPPVYHSFYDHLRADTIEDETLVLEDDTLVNSEDESVSEPSLSQQQVEELGFPTSVQHDTSAVAKSQKRQKPSPSQQQVEELGFPASMQHDTGAAAKIQKRQRHKRGVNTLLPLLSSK